MSSHFISPKPRGKGTLLFPFYRQGPRALERLRDLSKAKLSRDLFPFPPSHLEDRDLERQGFGSQANLDSYSRSAVYELCDAGQAT